MTASHMQVGRYYRLVAHQPGKYLYNPGNKLCLEVVRDSELSGVFSCRDSFHDTQLIDFIDVQPWKDAITHTATSKPICPQCGHIVSTPKLDETKLLSWLDSQIETLDRALTQELQDNGNLGDFITGHIVGMQNVRSKILLFRNEGI